MRRTTTRPAATLAGIAYARVATRSTETPSDEGRGAVTFSRDEIFESMADNVRRSARTAFDVFGFAETNGYGRYWKRETRDLLDKMAFMVLRLQADGVAPERVATLLRRTCDFTALEVSRRVSEIRSAHA
jgi:hypothetical protein